MLQACPVAVYGIRVPLRQPAVPVPAAVLPVWVADSSKAARPAPAADMRAAVPHTVRVVRTVAAGTSASGRLVAAVRKPAAVFRLTVRGAVPEPVVVLAVQRAGTAVPRLVSKGNNVAGMKARKATLELRSLLKEFRKMSVEVAK